MIRAVDRVFPITTNPERDKNRGLRLETIQFRTISNRSSGGLAEDATRWRLVSGGDRLAAEFSRTNGPRATRTRNSTILRRRRKILGSDLKKPLALRRVSHDFVSRPIRTCLWSCVGRRGSGQEASQPPLEDRQPEANRRTPPNGGRGLKQRRTGLFWSLPALQRSAPKEACLSCRACGRDFSSSKRWL